VPLFARAASATAAWQHYVWL